MRLRIDVVPGMDADGAVRGHLELCDRLRGLIDGDGSAPLEAASVSSDHQCALGKWIHGGAVLRYAQLAEFGALRDVHAQFHACAGNVLKVQQQGNQAAALALYTGALQQATDGLKRALQAFCVAATRYGRGKNRALALASAKVGRNSVASRSLWILIAGVAAVAVWRMFHVLESPLQPAWAAGLPEVMVFFAVTLPLFHFLVIGPLRRMADHLQNLESELATADAAFETLPAMLIADSNAMIVKVNRTFTEITGYTLEDALGSTPRLLKSDKQDAVFFAQMWKSLAGSGTWQGRLWNKRKDGGEFLADLKVNVLRAAVGEPAGYVATFTDLTGQRGALLATETSAPAAPSRSEFLAHMGHELRTPMNAVLGFTDLALEEPLDGKLRAYLQQVRDSGQAMMGKIDDILDLSKIEAGRIELEEIPFDLAEVCTGAYRKELILTAGSDVRVESAIDGDIPAPLLGDPVRVAQILDILIGNAVKFTDRGTVTLTVKLHRRNKGVANIGITVADTGIGMDEAEVARLFRPFATARTSARGRHGGSGLGLTIAKSLVEQMGGTIGVESSPGKGSTFKVVLALAVAEADAAADTTSMRMAERAARSSGPMTGAWAGIEAGRYTGKRALVAEDDEVNQALIRVVLGKFGFGVDIANTGREAVRLIEAAAQPYDLVLMDIRMPDMGGLEATRIIRAKHPIEALPIVALSANVFEEDRQKSLNAGMNEHLTKPLELNQLKQMLGRLFD